MQFFVGILTYSKHFLVDLDTVNNEIIILVMAVTMSCE